MSAKNWCFTFNNPQISGDALLELLSPLCGYCIFQLEQGDNGTPHFQGYIQWISKKRLSSCRKVLTTAHWEIARGTAEQSRDYCGKEDTRVDGPWVHGCLTVKGQRRDIEDFRDAILEGKTDLELVQEHCISVAKFPRFIDFVRGASSVRRNEKPFVECVYGPSGSGKTRYAMERSGFESTYVVSRPDSGRPLWWDSYDSRKHSTVVIDDFYGWLPWSMILQLIDRYPYQVEKKGGKLEFNSPYIIFTSNVHPEKWYKVVPNGDLTPLLRRFDNIRLLE